MKHFGFLTMVAVGWAMIFLVSPSTASIFSFPNRQLSCEDQRLGIREPICAWNKCPPDNPPRRPVFWNTGCTCLGTGSSRVCQRCCI